MDVSRFSLLRILADGEIHSGGQLGMALGLSRAGVSNRIRLIEGLGLPVLRVRGRGYRLGRALDLIDRKALAARVQKTCPAFAVEVVDECGSTNAALVERAARGAPHGTVIACEHQTAGRGRRGNAWHSAVGGSLAFSLLWRFSRSAGALAGLSLAVAVGAARALEKLGVVAVQLKWPNDLRCGERKLGGILIEMPGDASGAGAAVIGVGLNVRLDAALRERIDQPVTDVESCSDAPPSRTELLAALLESIHALLAQFAREGFAPFRDEWLRRHAWGGRRVAVSLADRCVAEGEALGVAEDGALMLATSRGVERFYSGELTLRRA